MTTPHQRPNLKQRLDALRQEPEPPVDVTLRLDGGIYQRLQALALAQNLSVAAYIVKCLQNDLASADTSTEV